MNPTMSKKFFAYVIPSVLAFTLSGIYTIVDGFFIGQSLGDVGFAAIMLGYPISALVGAIGTGLGSSGSIRYTSLNAQDETQKQEECFSGTILLMLLVGAILSVTLFGLSAPILRLLGAQGEILTLCVQYAHIIALGAIFQLMATIIGQAVTMAASVVFFFDNEEAACVIRDTKVSVVPFDQVNAEHAYKEGEDDRSLEKRREVHRRAFAPDYQAADLPFDESGEYVLEEFEVVYPKNELNIK